MFVQQSMVVTFTFVCKAQGKVDYKKTNNILSRRRETLYHHHYKRKKVFAESSFFCSLVYQ